MALLPARLTRKKTNAAEAKNMITAKMIIIMVFLLNIFLNLSPTSIISRAMIRGDKPISIILRALI